jgi:hypothetical protein
LYIQLSTCGVSLIIAGILLVVYAKDFYLDIEGLVNPFSMGDPKIMGRNDRELKKGEVQTSPLTAF